MLLNTRMLLAAHRMLSWLMPNCWLRSRRVNWPSKEKKFVNFDCS